MHYFGPEMGGGGGGVRVCPELHGICGGKRPLGVFNVHIALQNSQISAKRMLQGRDISILFARRGAIIFSELAHAK